MKHLDRYRGCLLGGAAGDAKQGLRCRHDLRRSPCCLCAYFFSSSSTTPSGGLAATAPTMGWGR